MGKIFVCFVGIDGSGKSTLAERVFKRIKKKDKKVIKIYGRYKPILIKYIRVLGKRLFFRSGKSIFSDYDYYSESKKAIFRKVSVISKVYIGIIIFEYYFQIIFKIAIPHKIGYSVITDRYVYDTIINDIAIDIGLGVNETVSLVRKFSFFVPRPDITFLLHVPEQIAIKRKNDIPSLSYLREREEYYQEISIFEQPTVLDGTLEISELERQVFSAINKKVRRTN
jgi:thymidylate kinase